MTPISSPVRAMFGTTPGGRQRDAAAGNADAFIVGDDQQRVAHRLEIIQRLAHAHHHHIGDEAAAGRGFAVGPVVEAVARHHDLADDFARGEVAHQPLRAGVAERAVQRAADLRGNAQRAAVGFRNIDALDFMRLLDAVAARQSQQPFAGAVVGDLFGDHFGTRHREMLSRVCRAFPWRCWSSRQNSARRGHRSSATAAAPASCAAPAATPMAPSWSEISARDSPTSDGFAGGT